jgi:hypothetical protein
MQGGESFSSETWTLESRKQRGNLQRLQRRIATVKRERASCAPQLCPLHQPGHVGCGSGCGDGAAVLAALQRASRRERIRIFIRCWISENSSCMLWRERQGARPESSFPTGPTLSALASTLLTTRQCSSSSRYSPAIPRKFSVKACSSFHDVALPIEVTSSCTTKGSES